jgi:hypothetical protein
MGFSSVPNLDIMDKKNLFGNKKKKKKKGKKKYFLVP